MSECRPGEEPAYGLNRLGKPVRRPALNTPQRGLAKRGRLGACVDVDLLQARGRPACCSASSETGLEAPQQRGPPPRSPKRWKLAIAFSPTGFTSCRVHLAAVELVGSGSALAEPHPHVEAPALERTVPGVVGQRA